MATMIEAKAKMLPSATAGAIPWPIIIQIITAILAALSGGGICPQPTPPVPPKKGVWERWFTRNQVRKYLNDPELFHLYGRQLADEILDVASTSTPEELQTMLDEAHG